MLEKTIKSIKYKHVIYLTITVLLASYLSILLVDLLNIFNSRALLQGLEIPILWNFLFREKGPIEILQWIFLGGFTATSAFTAAKLREKEKRQERIFWSLFAVAGAIMLIEDATNIRHFAARQLQLTWYAGKIFETLFFGAIGTVMIVALIRYREKVFQHRTTAILVTLGFIFYGSAAFVSGPGDLVGTTTALGEPLYDITTSIGGPGLIEIYEEVDQLAREVGGLGIRYRLVDFLVEESLELLGAAFLLASSLSYWKHTTGGEYVRDKEKS